MTVSSIYQYWKKTSIIFSHPSVRQEIYRRIYSTTGGWNTTHHKEEQTADAQMPYSK